MQRARSNLRSPRILGNSGCLTAPSWSASPPEDIDRIEAERDYMRLHLGPNSYLLHETIGALEDRLDDTAFIRIHRSHIVRRDFITGLRHEGGGVWHAQLADGGSLRIGRKYLTSTKEIAGR